MDIVGTIFFIVAVILIAPWLLIISIPFVIFGIVETIVNKYKNKVLQLMFWLIESWPLHIFLFLVFTHQVALKLFPSNIEKVNNLSSTLLQITGGLMILFILNLNIGIITKKSLSESFFNYLKRFPFIKSEGVFRTSKLNVGWKISTGELKVAPAFKNLEGKVNFLQGELIRLENQIKKEAKEKNQSTEDKLMEEISSIKSQIAEINSTIKNIVAGGAKWEILGALNVSYGLLIPLVY